MAGTENWWPWPSLVWPFFIGCLVNENLSQSLIVCYRDGIGGDMALDLL